MRTRRGVAWFVGLLAGALLPFAPMTLTTPAANADPAVFDGKEIKDFCTISASGQSCPVFPPPPPLLNPGAALAAGPDAAESLRRLQDQAVDNTLADHQLPASDRDAVLSWGRADAQAELWALVFDALSTAAGERTTDQQNVVTWMTGMTSAQSNEAALQGGAEYATWAGLDTYEYWNIARTASTAELTNFLATDVRTYNFLSLDRGGYCRYEAPDPYTTEYDGSTSPNCFSACTSILGCPIPTPSYDQFVKWGEAVAANDFDTDDPQFAAQARAIASAVGFGATVAVAAAAATGLATTLSTVLATEVVSTIIWSAVADVFASAASAGAAVIGAVAIVIFAIVAAILEGIRVSENAQLPGKIAELVTGARTAVTDASTLADTADGVAQLFYYFVGATMPVPRNDLACDNSLIPPWGYSSSPYPGLITYVPLGSNHAITTLEDRSGCLNPPPIPPVSAADAHFLVTPNQVPAPNPQAAPTISLKDPSTGSATTVRLHDSWFVTKRSNQIGDASQSLRLRFTDWNGDVQLAWLLPDAVNGGYFFLGLQDDDSVTSLSSETCDTDGVCWESRTIEYVGADGLEYSASVEVPGAATGTPTYTPSDPVEASPVTFSAGDFEPPDSDHDVDYSWRFQRLGCGFLECVLAGEHNPDGTAVVAYDGPFEGETVSHSWQSIGPAKVELTATDQHGHSATTVFVVNVGNVAPGALALHQNETSVGVELTLQGVASDVGDQDDLNIVVNFGDGQQKSTKVGPNSIPLFDPAITRLRLGTEARWSILAQHTYTEPGTYYGTYTVSDWGGGTDSDGFVVRVTGQQKITFPEVDDHTYGDVVEMPATGTASSTPVTYTAAPADVCIPTGLTGRAVQLVGVGECIVTAHQEADAPLFLAADVVSRNFDVGPASLTITADDQTKVYGAEDPELTASYDGLVNGDTKDDFPDLVLTGAPTGADVGEHDITPSGSTNAHYDIEYVAGTETITPAPLTITADDKTKVYGAEDPDFTASYDGLVNGDEEADITGLVLAGPPTDADVGDYDITPSGASNPNYDIDYATGTQTITPAPLTITADDKSKVYGTDNPAYTASFDGLVNDDTGADFTGLTVDGPPTGSHVGEYDITPAGAANPNYDIDYATGTQTITPAPLTITADDKTKVYGSDDPHFTASYDGLVNGDIERDVDVSLSGPPTGAGAGQYLIEPSGAGNPDYDITFVVGTETITPAPLTIRPKDVTVASGLVPSYAWTGEGWVNGDSDATLAKPPNMLPSCSALAATGPSAITPGVYPGAIACSGAVDHDYDIAYGSATLTVDPTIGLDYRGLPDTVAHRAYLDGLQVALPMVARRVGYDTRHTFHFPTVVLGEDGATYVTSSIRHDGRVTQDIDVTASYLTMKRLVRRAAAEQAIGRREAKRLLGRWQDLEAHIAAQRNAKARKALHQFADEVREQTGARIRAATAQDLLTYARAVYQRIGGPGAI